MRVDSVERAEKGEDGLGDGVGVVCAGEGGSGIDANVRVLQGGSAGGDAEEEKRTMSKIPGARNAPCASTTTVLRGRDEMSREAPTELMIPFERRTSPCNNSCPLSSPVQMVALRIRVGGVPCAARQPRSPLRSSQHASRTNLDKAIAPLPSSKVTRRARQTV